MSKVAPRFKAYCVTWEDSRCPSGGWRWVSSLDDTQYVMCKSLGFLVAEDEKCIKLAANVGDLNYDEVQANAVIVIPKSCILKMKPLSA